MDNRFCSYRIKFLESTDNLIKVIRARTRTGKEIQPERANQVTVCLQQGRSFFEVAEGSPIEIKPLIVFYGMVGFAKALTMARSFKKLEALVRSHGLRDTSDQNATIDNLQVKIENKGTFQSMNDSIRSLEKISILDEDGRIQKIPKSTSRSSELKDKTISLKEILARIPGLESLYEDTYGEEAKVARCDKLYRDNQNQWIRFNVFIEKPFQSYRDLQNIVNQMRKKYRFLKEWRVVAAVPSFAVTFANIERPPNEFSKHCLPSKWWSEPDHKDKGCIFSVPLNLQSADTRDEDITSKIEPMCGNLRSSESYMIESLDDVHLSEVSLYYLGMYILSSLVRYRPNIWANSISRRFFPSSAVDDKSLAIIEFFLDLSVKEFPEMIINGIKEADG